MLTDYNQILMFLQNEWDIDKTNKPRKTNKQANSKVEAGLPQSKIRKVHLEQQGLLWLHLVLTIYANT